MNNKINTTPAFDLSQIFNNADNQALATPTEFINSPDNQHHSTSLCQSMQHLIITTLIPSGYFWLISGIALVQT
jgi:hypothetical protein